MSKTSSQTNVIIDACKFNEVIRVVTVYNVCLL